MLDEVPLEEAKEIQTWWSEHQERDRKRRQELKQKALAKLTKEEQEALGFFDINGV